MMRALLLLLALLPCLATAQAEPVWPYSLEDTFGKSEREVLTMGRDAWFDFFSEQPGGSSTAGMCDAEQIFGTALKRRNDRLFVSSTPERRKKIEDLRKHLATFYEGCIGLSATFSGGGTIWNISFAGIQASVEEKVGALGGLPFTPAPPRVASDVTKQLDVVGQVLRKQREELDIYKGSGYGYAIGVAELAKARKAYEGVLAIAKTLPRAQSDHVLDACLTRVKNIEFNIDGS